MEQLEEKIAREGEVVSDDILQVDTFLHRQIDPSLMDAMGKALAQRFAYEGCNCRNRWYCPGGIYRNVSECQMSDCR